MFKVMSVVKGGHRRVGIIWPESWVYVLKVTDSMRRDLCLRVVEIADDAAEIVGDVIDLANVVQTDVPLIVGAVKAAGRKRSVK